MPDGWSPADEDCYRGYTLAEARDHVAKQAGLAPLAIQLGHAAARGKIELDRAAYILEHRHMNCPIGLRRTGRVLWDAARQHERDRAHAERMVRYRVWPLCQQHAPGEQILAEARSVSDPLRPDEVLAICRDMARQSQRRRRRGWR